MLSILVVSDLTHASDEAIRGAASLGERTGAKLHVVHFTTQVTLPAKAAEVRRDITALRAAADALDDQLRRTLPPVVSAGGRRLELGVPHDAILDHARTVSADLLVMVPQPIWPADTRRLGSVLRHLVAAAAVPILLVRGPVVWPARHILVPVDHRDLALGVLERVCTWLGGAGCAGLDMRPIELEVLHVSGRIQDWREVAPSLDREVRAVEEIAWSRGVRVRRSVRWGAVPARRIVEMADGTGTDLVILSPKRPYTGVGTWEWVVRRSPRNVLLLPEIRAGPDRSAAATIDRPCPRSSGRGEAPGIRGLLKRLQTTSPGRELGDDHAL